MSEASVALEFDDIQYGVLRPPTHPYAATYVVLRIDDRKAGGELIRRAVGVVNSAADAYSVPMNLARNQLVNRSISRPWRSPRSLTERLSLLSLSITVFTMHAPARITSARFGCNPTIFRRSSSERER